MVRDYKIADHRVRITGEEDYIPDAFMKFRAETEDSFEIEWKICIGQPYKEEGKKTLICNAYIRIYQEGEGYWMIYPMASYHMQMEVRDNASRGILWLNFGEKKPKDIKTGVLYALRDAFFLKIQMNGMIAVHSASLIYQNRAYVFAGSSGTGKTTHINMWVEQYGTEILDGDVCALKIIKERVFAYGLPWCGTSDQFLNRQVQVEGIIFLQQSCYNEVVKLHALDSILRLTARCLTPNWSEEQMDRNIRYSEEIVKYIPCYLLKNRPEIEAVNLMKWKLEESQKESS